eukprot:COSAG02_NODE_9317_length_2258_cov_1.375174_1_plen_81_part_00
MGTYDDEQSIGLKYEFAVQHGVGIGICEYGSGIYFLHGGFPSSVPGSDAFGFSVRPGVGAINYPMGDEHEWNALQKMQEP